LTKLFPSIFAPSTTSNSYSRSQSKKPQYPSNKSADGQPFPFQIVKEEGFDVQHGVDNGTWSRGTSSKLGTSSTARANTSNSAYDEADDVTSEDSGEWIMMQKNPGIKVSAV
jgi:hypothetical protein